jgi:hypothetical protein
MARAWYAYKGSGDPCNRANYSLMTITPSCVNGSNLCAIYEYDGGAQPSGISANICRYISNLLATGLAQPQVPINAKKYVYGKS